MYSFNDTEWKSRNSLISTFSFPQLYRCIDGIVYEHASNDEIPQVWGATNFRSQGDEDQWLWKEIFRKLPVERRVAGNFIEIGALDGVGGSNTFFFEKSLDWRGILIEAHPENGLRKVQDVRKNSAIFTAAVCPLGGSELFTHKSVRFTKRGGPVGASIGDASDTHLKVWHPNGTENSISISCLPLQHFIDATGLYDVDLFSLDVEGAELTVLQTLEFNVTNVRVIVVELDGTNLSKDAKVRKLLFKNGFVEFVYSSRPAERNPKAIRDQCRFKKRGACPENEVFVNPRYEDRRRLKKNFFEYGTGKLCERRNQPYKPS